MARPTRTRRANAALEYMVTYGWALFGIFVVISFLLGAGVFNPNRFVSDECTLQPNMVCTSYFIQNYETRKVWLSFNLTNTMGFPIGIRGYSATIRDLRTDPCASPGTCMIYLGQGDSVRLNITTNTPYDIVGPDTVKADLNISYTSCAGLDKKACLDPSADLPLHQSGGRMISRVRE
ncbi:MAG: hypothetical protein V1728_02695 [Candidatus Micrarchaeota archaeon]